MILEVPIRVENIVGNKYNMLTVISYNYKKNGTHFWLCRCDCGKTTTVSRGNLVGAKVKSCGCLHQGSPSHGMHKTRFYKIWCGMKSRCYEVNNPKYKNYGARGIIICDYWKNSFENFRDDMLESYNKHVEEFGEANTSIDRINVNGNYCKENCKWSTNIEQANNTTTNHYFTYKGETKSIADWSRISGINYGTLKCRLTKYGWDVEKAIEIPVRNRRN